MTLVVRIFPSRGAVEDAAVARLQAEFTQPRTAPFGVLLPGGATPLPVYRRLARQPLGANPQLHILYTDERLVPTTSHDSNFGNTKPLLARLGLAGERVLRVRPELPPADSAADYEARLARFLGGGEVTLGLLGLGSDGHTCSLFTPAAAARRDRLAFAVPPVSGFARVTVSAALLARAQRLIFLVTGLAKQAVIARLQAAPETLPAGIAVAGHPAVELWTDVPLAP